MEDMMNEIIAKSIGKTQEAQYRNVNFAIKRLPDGGVEWSVNGFDPRLVIEAYEQFLRLMEKVKKK